MHIDRKLRRKIEEKKQAQQKTETYKKVLDFLEEALKDRVKAVRLSANLGKHAVSIVPDGGVSFEMEKYFRRVNPEMNMKADRILELNADHAAFLAIGEAVEKDPQKARDYAELLYNQALLMADLPIEDPVKYADLVCSLIK